MHQRLLSLLVFVLSFHIVLAQDKFYETANIQEGIPKIDGIFDEPLWQTVEWEGNFTQFQPNKGEKPRQKTEFKIVYDSDNIYIAVKAYDTEIDKIEKRMTRRDGWDGDRVGIHFDSYFDKRTAFVFFVNASGIKNDGIMTDDGDDFDDSWDPIWYTKTSINEDGWNAEIKIPLSQLRFSQKDKQTWGLQVIRHLFRESESSMWKHIPKDVSGWTSNYGKLNGLNGLKPKRQIELAPFSVGKFDKYKREEGNPYAKGSDFGYNIGVDGKVGITNNLILDFTINPDFGQVEADPSEVNLSAFESFFSEKRPFFIEGKNITDYQITPGGNPWSSDNLFYSRRIGRRPHGDPELEENEFSDVPINSKILGAFKVTGKTKDGWSIGLIESIVNKEEAEIDTEGETRKEIVEPYTNYLIGRVQKDINKGNSIIGGMFTTTHRKLKDTNLDYLNASAITGGLDLKQYFLNKKYFVSTKFVTSKINGSEEAILDQQLSSKRYFQRPDANYLSVDSALTSLSGHGGTFLIGKQANSGLRFLFNTTWRSAGLELNDLGYMRQANTVFQYIWAGYKITTPFSIFRRASINFNQWSGWDFGGVNLFKGSNINLWSQFENLWEIEGGFNVELDEISNTMLRGGPSIKLPGSLNGFFGIQSNETKKLYAYIGYGYNLGNKGFMNRTRYSVKISYRPINNLSFSLSPRYVEYNTKLQYIDDPNYNNESRYIFGTMNQKTFSLTARIDFNLSSDLTIQYYASPFISAGVYTDLKRITDPKANTFEDRFEVFRSEISYSGNDELYYIDESGNGGSDYSFENPNFNFKQFRSNFVLRWEFTPGSLLYLVWSQGKTGDESYERFNYSKDMENLFAVTGHNTFLIKLSYRFRAEKWL